MLWSLPVGELPDLLSAFADAEALIHPAFAAAVGPFGFSAPPPEIDRFRPDRAEWRIGWWLYLPDHLAPYEAVRCELDLGAWDSGREVCGWIGVDRYVGHGATVDDELWRSVERPVGSPSSAAAAVRAVAGELVEQLGRVDLRRYLAAKPAEPGGPPDPGRDLG
jgi:hypothetical protein